MGRMTGAGGVGAAVLMNAMWKFMRCPVDGVTAVVEATVVVKKRLLLFSTPIKLKRKNGY